MHYELEYDIIDIGAYVSKNKDPQTPIQNPSIITSASKCKLKFH
jgi:hypothetical protein